MENRCSKTGCPAPAMKADRKGRCLWHWNHSKTSDLPGKPKGLDLSKVFLPERSDDQWSVALYNSDLKTFDKKTGWFVVDIEDFHHTWKMNSNRPPKNNEGGNYIWLKKQIEAALHARKPKIAQKALEYMMNRHPSYCNEWRNAARQAYCAWKEIRRLLYWRQEGQCHLCGGRMSLDEKHEHGKLHTDHLVSLDENGPVLLLRNMGICHSSCNSTKGRRSWDNAQVYADIEKKQSENNTKWS